MAHIIYVIENEANLVEAYDSAYNITITTIEDNALTFESEIEAQATCDILNDNKGESTSFWGSRPTRPH